MLDDTITLRVHNSDRLYRSSASAKPGPAMTRNPNTKPTTKPADEQDPASTTTIIHRLFNQQPPAAEPMPRMPDYPDDEDTDWLPMQQEKPKRNWKGPIAGALVGVSVVAITVALRFAGSPPAPAPVAAPPPPPPPVATAPQKPPVAAPKPPPVRKPEPVVEQPAAETVQPPPVQRPVQQPPVQQQAMVVPPVQQQAAPPPPPPNLGISVPELVTISGGTFLMGSNEDPTEQPVHKVAVQSFMLGKFPVTVRQWRECVDALGCDYMPANAGSDNAPISNISWRDAQQYVTWLSAMTRQQYRLPTEAEWEYAARGGSSTRYWWGDNMRPGMADCKGCGGSAGHPQRVGMHSANLFGLYDIGGGVSEWVSDCWNKDYHGTPLDNTAYVVPGCQEHVLRGGAWNNDASYVRSSSRDHYATLVRYPTHGLRVARSF